MASLVNHNATGIIRYLIDSEGIYQKDISKILDISDSTMSRILGNKHELSLRHWSILCSYFQINIDAFYTGIITTRPQDPKEFLNDSVPHRNFLYTSGKVAFLYNTFFKNTFGVKLYNDFLKSEKVSNYHFVNINNPIDINYSLRIVQYARMRGYLKSQKQVESFSRLTNLLSNAHGEYYEVYEGLSGIVRLKALLDRINQYETNNRYRIQELLSDKKIIFSVEPREHIDFKIYKDDPFIGSFITDYIKEYAKVFTKSNAFVKILECLHSGADRNIYEVVVSQ